MATRTRIGLLHLAPQLSDRAANWATLRDATRRAAAHGCDWVASGELVATGYDFTPDLGTDWIEPIDECPDLAAYSTLVAELGIVAFVNVPERDGATGALHSALVAIGRDGAVAGRHRKIAVIPGSESWATAGSDAVPVDVDGVRVGLLICADAHLDRAGDLLAERGADVFVSSAAWAPGFHGPDGEWESISARTGRPVVVANRTGADRRLDFCGSSSVVAIGGERVVDAMSPTSEVVVVDLDLGPAPSARVAARLPM